MAPGTHIGAAHPVRGRRREDRRDDGEEDGVGRGGRRADVGDRPRPQRAAGRRGRPREPVVHRAGGAHRDAAAHRPRRDRRAATCCRSSTAARSRASTAARWCSTPRGARVVAIEMSWRQRVLSALAHPNIAYLLLSLGMLGLTIELWNPGAVLPGVAGGLCLLLAFFTFQVLPVNYAGVLLILFGIALLILEVKVTSHGVLSVGGHREPAVRLDDPDGQRRAGARGQPVGHPARRRRAVGDPDLARAPGDRLAAAAADHRARRDDRRAGPGARGHRAGPAGPRRDARRDLARDADEAIAEGDAVRRDAAVDGAHGDGVDATADGAPVVGN